MTKEEVKRLRTKLGMTQQALADALGVTQTSVARWEMGMHQIEEPYLPPTETARENENQPQGEEMSLYQRKDTEGNLISPYWDCEFNDGGKVVRKSTEIKMATRTVKAGQRREDFSERNPLALLLALLSVVRRIDDLRRIRQFVNSGSRKES